MLVEVNCFFYFRIDFIGNDLFWFLFIEDFSINIIDFIIFF